MATILVIDDEFGVRITLKTMLEAKKHEVILAEDGILGIKKIELYREDLDLIITDIMMPGANGIAVIKAARQIDPEIPVVAISGGGNRLEDNDPLAIAVEIASDVLRKPFNAEELDKVLVKFLK